MVQRSYNCAQQELYTVCRLGWQSYQQHLAAFTGFKTKYTGAFGADRLDEVDAAEALPDEDTRDSVSETFRILLAESGTNGLSLWQKLKRYIADAYPPVLQKPKLEAAGQNYYAKAGKEDWESVQALLNNAVNFITTNEADLEAGDNMPNTFLATMSAARTDFKDKHQQFLDSEETASINGDAKANANNDIHKKLMSMFLDGQEIFKDNDAVVKQFIFDHALGLVRGTATAGFKGSVTDSIKGFPLPGVSITIDGLEKSAITDEDGKYSITEIASNTYNVTFSLDGFEDKIVTITVKVGTVSNLNAVLTKL